jgi:hypothetical protein
MVNCAYARGTKLCESRIFILQPKQHFFIVLFEVRRCCLFLHTAYEFNDEIMKIAQGHLNKKFQVRKLSTDLLFVKRELQIFKV